MLPLPESNWSRPQVLASWLELCALAEDDGAAYRGSALESLRDSQLFIDADVSHTGLVDSVVADSAAGKLADTWQVLRRREQILQDAWPFDLSEDALTRKPGWKTLREVAAYATMLLIEAATFKWYTRAAILPGDAVREWFEHIATAAISRFALGMATRFGAPFPESWQKPFQRGFVISRVCFKCER